MTTLTRCPTCYRQLLCTMPSVLRADCKSWDDPKSHIPSGPPPTLCQELESIAADLNRQYEQVDVMACKIPNWKWVLQIQARTLKGIASCLRHIARQVKK